jgi:hypothetical protein
MVLIAALPVLGSLVLAGGMATRYILWVVPFVYLLVALGIVASWRLRRPLGVVGLLIVGLVAWLGTGYYFGAYRKSEYREMANYLRSQALPDDATILEAPRQHLLAKYYLPSAGHLYSMPAIDLPDYWPVTSAPVVPEEVDHELGTILQRHGKAWLILTGEDEVDQGEFVEKYLTAISYPRGCRRWLDVRLCEFQDPDYIPVTQSAQTAVGFEGGMELSEARIGLDESGLGNRYVYVSPLWHASAKPSTDFTVTLRLLGPDGVAVSQSDGLPIGPLLPPTTWDAGDTKTGYMVLQVPETVAPGEYDLAIGLYDPTSLRQMPISGERTRVSDLVRLRAVKTQRQRLALPK